jgi:hypothetical protein
MAALGNRQRVPADSVPNDDTTHQRHGYHRRLSDKILLAFHQACDQGDIEVADRLLSVLAEVVSRRSGAGGYPTEGEVLIGAYERLWHLRRPSTP